MLKALRFTSATLLCSLVLALTSHRCAAQRANCETSFNFKGAKELKLSALFQIFSEEQKISVFAEIPYDLRGIEVPSGDYSLVGLAKMFDSALHCEAVDGVLHVFDDSVISLKGNALSYQFAAFRMPPNVNSFRIMLTQRLRDEAFGPPRNGKSVIQESGGGISWNAEKSSLREHTYRDVQARNLVFAAASEHILSSVICFPDPEKQYTDLEVWKFASAHWYWGVNDSVGTRQ